MKRLGYYAKDVNDNLFQFRWSLNKFEILVVDSWIEKDPNEYEILEIGHFISE